MSNHTPGVWDVEEDCAGAHVTANGAHIAHTGGNHQRARSNANRITECVNVFDGIDNPAKFSKDCVIALRAARMALDGLQRGDIDGVSLAHKSAAIDLALSYLDERDA